ncbi:MAG: cyclic nucleotide-binding domain-containing protein [Vicinamibacterales bacterium]
MRKALLFLGILNDADLDWMIQAGERRVVPSGTRIITQGEPMEDVFLVLDGAFRVTLDGEGGRTVDVATLRAGEIVGEMSFVDSRPPSASVLAEAESTVLAVPKAALTERLDDPSFASRFYRAIAMFLADRLRTSTSRLGYGAVEDAASPSDDDIDPDVLGATALAGARFDWMLRRLGGV